MFRIAVITIILAIIPSIACHIDRPVSLLDIEVSLQSPNLSRAEINLQIKNLVTYSEQHQLSAAQKAEIDSSLAHKSFLTHEDSLFLIEISNRIHSEDADSLFINYKMRFYRLFFNILDDYLLQTFNQNEQRLENRNLEIAEWVASRFDSFLNNSFLRSQLNFYLELEAKNIKNKLLVGLYNDKAWSLLSVNQKNSLALIAEGLRLAKETGDRRKEIDLLTLLQFILFYHNSVPHSGLALGNYLLDETNTLGYETGRGRVNFYQGNILIDMGYSQQALEQFELARDLYVKLDYKSWFPFIFERIGIVHRSLGRFDLALQTFERMFQPEEKNAKSPSQVRYKLGLANIHMEMSEYPIAENLLLEGLKVAQKLNDADLEATALSNLAGLYTELGDYPRSIEFRQKALEKYQVTGKPSSIASVWSRLSATYVRNNEREKAKRALSKAFEYVSKFDLGMAKARTLINLARLQLQANELEGALKSLKQAWHIFEQIESFYLQIETLNLLGETHRRLGNHESALEALNKAVDLTEELPTFQLKVDTYLELARVYKTQDKTNSAEGYFASAISSVKQTASELVNNEQRLNFSQKIQPMFEEMVLLQLAKNDPELAFFYAEEERAQVLKILLQGRSDEKHEQFDAALGARPPQEAENYLQKIRALQNALDDKTVLVEYEVTDSLLVSWVISGHRFEVRQVQVSRDELEQLISEFRAYNHPDSLETSRLFKRSFQKTEALGRRFYDYLIAPISDYIADAKRVYFVPDEALSYLPFAAIKTPEDNYLIQNFAIASAQSAEILKASLMKEKRASGAHGGFLAVAANEDLTYSRAEAEAVRDLHPDTKTLLGARITEKVIRDELLAAPYRLILLSTHGKLNEKKPYFSGLMLNKEPSGTSVPENNGFLTVQEIQKLALEGTDLVYLSACESASGRLYRGEGIVGMQRAFLIAGANSVIANLWKIDDKASKNLTVEFFKKWVGGTYTKAEALRLAQLSRIDQLRKSAMFNKHAHPYFWAAVTLTGSSD